MADRWREAIARVKQASPRHGRSLAFGRLIALRPGEAVLAFPKDAAFHRATVTGTARPVVEKALSDYFGEPTRLIEETSEAATASAAPSMAEEEAQGRADREKGLEAKIRSHPAVRSAMKILRGELEHVQVLERERPGQDADSTDDPPAGG